MLVYHRKNRLLWCIIFPKSEFTCVSKLKWTLCHTPNISMGRSSGLTWNRHMITLLLYRIIPFLLSSSSSRRWIPLFPPSFDNNNLPVAHTCSGDGSIATSNNECIQNIYIIYPWNDKDGIWTLTLLGTWTLPLTIMFSNYIKNSKQLQQAQNPRD